MQRFPVVGQVKRISSHPNADKLHIASIDVGQGNLIDIIFGGSRLIKKGELVAVALPGTHLPSGEKIRSRNYRGVKSYGELLSSNELGWSTNGPDEVLILPEKYKIGDVISK